MTYTKIYSAKLNYSMEKEHKEKKNYVIWHRISLFVTILLDHNHVYSWRTFGPYSCVKLWYSKRVGFFTFYLTNYFPLLTSTQDKETL